MSHLCREGRYRCATGF